jgi:hypothetical protein
MVERKNNYSNYGIWYKVLNLKSSQSCEKRWYQLSTICRIQVLIVCNIQLRSINTSTNEKY